MKHLMIDLETLATRVNAPVVAIGACFFEPSTGEIGDTFEAAISISEAMKYGVAEGSTIDWWLGQSDAARQKVKRGKSTAPDAFKAFVAFCEKGGDNIQPWGNGASFDISILDYAIPKILGRPVPWKFWNVRDCRTIKEMATAAGLKYEKVLEGTAHTALDDAKHQAGWVSHYWQGLVAPKLAAPLSLDI